MLREACVFCETSPVNGCPLCGPTADDGRAEFLEEFASAIYAEQCRRSFATFARRAWPHIETVKLEWNWHLQVICDHAQALGLSLIRARRGGAPMAVQNVLFNIPPRCSKTVLLGTLFGTWLWLHDPTLKIRYISGNANVSSAVSRSSRDLIACAWFQTTFQPSWQVREDVDNIGLYTNTARGERRFSSMESRITGEGTDVIIADDLLDAKLATSEKVRNKVNEYWATAINNRVNDAQHCLRIGVMQRLHAQDWSDLVLRMGWRHVCIPMEQEEGRACLAQDGPCADCKAGETFLGWKDPRTPGELLHAARFPLKVLDDERKNASYWAGQHQQRPTVEEGDMFKAADICPVDPLPKFEQMRVFADLQFKESGTSRTAFMVAGRKGANRYVTEMIVKRMGPMEAEATIVELAKRYPGIGFVIEDAGCAQAVFERLNGKVPGIVLVKPTKGDKVERAYRVKPYVDGRNLCYSKGAPWADDYIYEMTAFPNGVNDDQVDVTTMMLEYWQGTSRFWDAWETR